MKKDIFYRGLYSDQGEVIANLSKCFSIVKFQTKHIYFYFESDSCTCISFDNEQERDKEFDVIWDMVK